MLIKGLLNAFQMRVGSILGREVLVLGTAGGGKDVSVDGGVVEGADATIVHTNLTEEHVIELGGYGLTANLNQRPFCHSNRVVRHSPLSA